MSLADDEQKVKSAEQKALNKLNQEEGWVERHPGWTTLIGTALLLMMIVLLVKSCH